MKTIDRVFKLWVHLVMKKTSFLPLIIIVATFLVIPVVYWLVTFDKSSDNVQGVKTGIYGISINVISKNGAWDMSKYLCKDKEECLESLTSGKLLEKTSGGGVNDQSVTLRHSSDWESYEFLKIFVLPGWGSMDRNFEINPTEKYQGLFVEPYPYSGKEVRALIIPTGGLNTELFEVATFTD